MGKRKPSDLGHFVMDGFGDLTREIDSLCVGVNDDFDEHLGMVAVSSATGIGGRKSGKPLHE
nr:hypothetical protein [Paenibacillus sp. EZ-K15]